MGLDVRFTQRKKIVCQHCGKLVDYKDVDETQSGGRCWYPFLQAIGYYVPNSDEDRWYGKDMGLTKEQTKDLYEFLHSIDAYNLYDVKRIVAVAMAEEDDIFINADW
jgi:hypothetical protein